MITVDLHCLNLPAGSRILDIGCGSGRHVAAAYALDQAIVVGADPDLGDLRQARGRLCFHDQCGAHGNGCWALSAADITRLPFADGAFDLVICSEVLEHIPDHRRAMAEIVRVLQPGAPLVVSVPRRWPEWICWRLSPAYRRMPGGHVRIYDAHCLVRQVEAHGVRHWRTHFAHGLHTPFWWLKCLLGLERDTLAPVRLYHRFLTWDIMQKPRLTRTLDRWLNPLCGKSVVLYFRKPAAVPTATREPT
ncbi:class I SAM-dependent methyltransferase [Desulfatitalea alkaliphila]|uniref:Methyltransferase domain-containing protein n=1 Tax=Desulfatitalea alkaliphila TaxID=2929485 RepID=A0AA41UKH9_9BACT|nr:class I SAM-dependent methyltransferase [Desulfatitalea alkaliphila]MCJ8503100.1 methyltransferase domain-containing protein [Desulfatitalea alkaliphila]